MKSAARTAHGLAGPSAPDHYANLAGLEVGDRFPARIVAAVNVSPESFYSGSVVSGRRALQRRAEQLIDEGADMLDIGAMSTAPYRQGAISEEEEVRRIRSAIDSLRAVARVPISVDTQRSRVAAVALQSGAEVINDISGLAADPEMATVARDAGGLILMAREDGVSKRSPIAQVSNLLRLALRRADSAGISAARIVLDPGVGFFRRGILPWYEFDCVLLAELRRFQRLGRPLLVGASRKSFVGRLSGHEDVSQRLAGSVAAAAIAVYNGASMIRTHDVAATLDAVRVAAAIRG
jgi:dihydropteroate synthase